ncbi:MAG: hypothetical protein ABFD83_10480 [Armatimonadota bacterium]
MIPYKVSLENVPTGVTAHATAKALNSFSPSLVGNDFVAAATCTPAGTTFTQAVKLVFTMDNAITLNDDEMLVLGHLNSSGQVVLLEDNPVTLSADGKTASVQLTEFDGTYNDYILLIVPSTKIDLTVPTGAAPSGVTPTVESKTLEDTPDTPGNYPLYVASVECLPAGTTFSQPVTLTFHLSTAMPDGRSLVLYEPNGSGGWAGTDVEVSLSDGRKTATVNVDHFTSNGFYMLWLDQAP